MSTPKGKVKGITFKNTVVNYNLHMSGLPKVNEGGRKHLICILI